MVIGMIYDLNGIQSSIQLHCCKFSVYLLYASFDYYKTRIEGTLSDNKYVNKMSIARSCPLPEESVLNMSRWITVKSKTNIKLVTLNTRGRIKECHQDNGRKSGNITTMIKQILYYTNSISKSNYPLYNNWQKEREKINNRQ